MLIRCKLVINNKLTIDLPFYPFKHYDSVFFFFVIRNSKQICGKFFFTFKMLFLFAITNSEIRGKFFLLVLEN